MEERSSVESLEMIGNLLKKYARFIFSDSWTREENSVFLSLLEKSNKGVLVDLGCGSGRLTLKFINKMKPSLTIGVEPGKIKRLINKNKMRVLSANLNHKLPLKNNYADVVTAHFVIEHLYNVDVFIKETKRILKKGGYTLVATDNLSSWPNILSLILGWQPFSSAYGVARKPLGNPMSVGGDFIVEKGDSLGELSHNKVLAYKMLIDAYREYGFRVDLVKGVGYFPFYGYISKFFSWVDIRHTHLLVLKATKI